MFSFCCILPAPAQKPGEAADDEGENLESYIKIAKLKIKYGFYDKALEDIKLVMKLDSKNAEELHELFFNLRNEFGQTFVIVTHNEELANMTDRKLVMADGLFESL